MEFNEEKILFFWSPTKECGGWWWSARDFFSWKPNQASCFLRRVKKLRLKSSAMMISGVQKNFDTLRKREFGTAPSCHVALAAVSTPNIFCSLNHAEDLFIIIRFCWIFHATLFVLVKYQTKLLRWISYDMDTQILNYLNDVYLAIFVCEMKSLIQLFTSSNFSLMMCWCW